jgi:hypothetical protein
LDIKYKGGKMKEYILSLLLLLQILPTLGGEPSNKYKINPFIRIGPDLGYAFAQYSYRTNVQNSPPYITWDNVTATENLGVSLGINGYFGAAFIKENASVPWYLLIYGQHQRFPTEGIGLSYSGLGTEIHLFKLLMGFSLGYASSNKGVPSSWEVQSPRPKEYSKINGFAGSFSLGGEGKFQNSKNLFWTFKFDWLFMKFNYSRLALNYGLTYYIPTKASPRFYFQED